MFLWFLAGPNIATIHQAMIVSQQDLERLISSRRTSKPSWFNDQEPDHADVRHAIDVARKAPNHHRTEPARFYLLDKSRIKEVGRLFGEVVAGASPDEFLIDRAAKKTTEWSSSPGLIVVTCFTDHSSELVASKPNAIEEDYATCACICQNLLLLLHNLGIAAKWSTGPVWKHRNFRQVVGIPNPPPDERVIALIFYGHTEKTAPSPIYAPIEMKLSDYSNSP
jgi:nitroreductase